MVLVRRRERVRRRLDGDALIASTRNGGMFSLLWSPSSMVNEDLKRFVDGVDSGVMGSFESRSTEGEGDEGSAIA